MTIRIFGSKCIRMLSKLTLSVEKYVVQKAKAHARAQGRSLSEVVTSYLRRLSTERGSAEMLDPQVMAVSDEIPLTRVPDLVDERFQYLKSKLIHG